MMDNADAPATDSTGEGSVSRPSSGRRKWATRTIGLMILLTVGAEIIAGKVFGLGDPPLMIEDQDTEYRLKPSMTYRRFGHTYHVNAYSMRSEDFPARKTDPREVRVMVLGDSVVNGGAQLAQEDLATGILRGQLAADLGRPVVVGNVAAGSWGPPNLLAYTRRFGFFDADVVVIVLSSHDADDVPDGRKVVGVDPEFPGQSPIFALQELVGRYGMRLLRRRGAASNAVKTSDSARVERSLAALSSLIAEARAAHAEVVLAQHLESSEAPGRERPGNRLIAEVARQAGVPIVALGPALARAAAEGRSPYRDEIHPTAAGQRIIAEQLLGPIEDAVGRSGGPARGPQGGQ